MGMQAERQERSSWHPATTGFDQMQAFFAQLGKAEMNRVSPCYAYDAATATLCER